MKKTAKILALVLSLVMVLSLFAGCADKTSEETSTGQGSEVTENDDTLKIGLSLPTQREERWVLDKENFEKVAEDLGVELAIQIADNDAAKQQSQCENLIAMGIDVLILAPHDGTAAANIVEMAHEAGIKVVSYDRLVMIQMLIVFNIDSIIVGEMQAEWLLKQVPEGGNVALLAGDPGDSCAVLYRQGALNVLQPKVDSGVINLV